MKLTLRKNIFGKTVVILTAETHDDFNELERVHKEVGQSTEFRCGSVAVDGVLTTLGFAVTTDFENIGQFD